MSPARRAPLPPFMPPFAEDPRHQWFLDEAARQGTPEPSWSRDPLRPPDTDEDDVDQRVPIHVPHRPRPDGTPGPALVLVIVGIPLLLCAAAAVWALAGFPGLPR